MIKHLSKTKVLISGTTAFLIGIILYLFFDAFYGDVHFRTMQDPISDSKGVDLTGLRELKASGGNLPRFAYVSWKLNHIKGDKIMFDLKQEFHGYVSGIPSSFLGYHFKDKDVKFKQWPRRLIFTGTFKKRPELVLTEAQEGKKYGFGYINVSIGSKYLSPNKNIDDFVSSIDAIPNDTWIHFHCFQGRGRTSMALAMFDIMKNAPIVALKDIVRRQYLLGSVDLFDTKKWVHSKYSKKQLEDRKHFIENFYIFICQRKAGGIQKWTDWRRQKIQDNIPRAAVQPSQILDLAAHKLFYYKGQNPRSSLQGAEGALAIQRFSHFLDCFALLSAGLATITY